MTLWPDQPTEAGAQPQTRRQARANERSQAARRAGTAEPTPAGEIPDLGDPDGTADAGRPDAGHGGGDGARPAIPATAFGFDGLYGDPSGRQEQASLFRQSPDPSRPEPVTQPMTIVRPTPEQEAAPPLSGHASSEAAPAQPAAAAGAPAGADAPAPERTLTRRELRAMLQAQEANQQANTGAPHTDAVFPVTFTDRPEAEAAASKAVDEPQAAAAGAPAAEGAAVQSAPAASPETPTSEKTAWPFAPLTPSAAPKPSAGAPDTTVTQSPASPFAAFGTVPASPQQQEEDAPASASRPVEAGAPSPASSDAASNDVAAQERRPFTPPTGHWSMAAELEDGNEPITTRNVGHSTAATTTNALILPSLPQPDATGPLTSTGEILVTGSIDLPRTLGSTGAHPDRIDSSDLDRLLDGEENEFNTSEVAPVRASRAISTHTSTRGVIAPPKKRGNTLPVVLMITAGVLAVGVIGLLVAAYVLKVF